MAKVKYSKIRTHQRYKLGDGSVATGVTTALNIISKPALMHWAWKCGCDGIDYRKTRDQAADIGSLAHWMCECHLKGVEPDMSEFSPADTSKAENAFLKFLDWWQKGKYTLTASEIQLVSEIYRYGGTLDIVARDTDDRLCLCDIKTSKAVYEEMWYQVAAYQRLWDEHHPYDMISSVSIVRIGKQAEDGDFEVQTRKDLAKHFTVFKAALHLYQAMKNLK